MSGTSQAAAVTSGVVALMLQGLDKIALIGIAMLATSLVAGTLWFASPIKRQLGNTGINIATLLMALIVASVATDFILTGLKNQLRGVLGW
jgi:multiple antibiotic resistance protein